MTRRSWGFLAFVVLAASGCARVQRLDLNGIPTMTLADLRADSTPLEHAIRAGQTGAVIRIAAGERLPVRLSLRSSVINLEAGDNSLRFDRDAYLYVSRDAIMASPDRERWARIGDHRGLGRLFGVEHGSLEIGFGVHRSEGPRVTVGLSERLTPGR
jgi:hypothetical protein